MLIAIRHSTKGHDAHIVCYSINTFSIVAHRTNDSRNVCSVKRCISHDVVISVELIIDIILVVLNNLASEITGWCISSFSFAELALDIIDQHFIGDIEIIIVSRANTEDDIFGSDRVRIGGFITLEVFTTVFFFLQICSNYGITFDQTRI